LVTANEVILDAQIHIFENDLVDTHVRNLRCKVADACPGTDIIESVYGIGYRPPVWLNTYQDRQQSLELAVAARKVVLR
jgi:hypothetical protein